MLRIFLTGDNHIGRKYSSHAKAAEIAEERVAVFSRLVERANAEQCSLFVIAGDLFDNTYGVAKREIRRLLELLSAFRGTVVYLPGNHDHYDPDAKLWQYFIDAQREWDNILLLNEYRPYPLSLGDGEAVLYPAFCTSLHSAPGENNLGWIAAERIVPDGKYRLGLAHGAVEGETIDREGAYFRMSRSELEAIPVDAWLIGHTHVPFPRDFKTGAWLTGARIFNAGTHVQTDVSCNTEGCCFLIEIAPGPGMKEVRAKKIVFDTLRFYRRRVTVSPGRMAEELERAVEDLPDRAAVELLVDGAVSAEEYAERAVRIEAALSRFLEGSYQDFELSLLITPELVAREFPETSFAAGLLMELLDDPKEAQLAYELMKAVREEGKR